MKCDDKMPKGFELKYVYTNGKCEQAIMVHRAIYLSVQRVFGLLIESYTGKFPLWLAPGHLKVFQVTNDAREFCKGVVYKDNFLEVSFEVDCSV